MRSVGFVWIASRATIACAVAGLLLGSCGDSRVAANEQSDGERRASGTSGVKATPAPAPIARQALLIAEGLEIPDERDNLSGAACSPMGSCLLIGDEMRFARLFTLSDGTLTPGDPLFLLPAQTQDGKKTKESDGEGIAFDDSYFYAIGSHSADKEGKSQSSRHFVARIPVDRASGRPVGLGTRDQPPAALQKVDLDYLLATDPLLATYAKERPGEGGEHGPNIEGVAVSGGMIYIGFRGPVDEAGAALYRLPVEELFGGRKPVAPPIRIKLEAHGSDASSRQGIRDLAAVSDGLLILAGPEARAGDPRPELWHRSTNGDVRFLVGLGDFDGDSPEAIAVLSETDRKYQVLVLADGKKKSAPIILDIPKRATVSK